LEVLGLEPVAHGLAIAAGEREQGAIGTHEQQGELAGLAVRVEAAPTQGRAVTADDLTEVLLGEASSLPALASAVARTRRGSAGRRRSGSPWPVTECVYVTL